MSFLITTPETLNAAAADLNGLGSMIDEAHAAAAAPTTGLLPAAADEISTAIAKLFGAHAQQFHAASAQAAAFHAEFVQALKGGAGAYAASEAANASPLRAVEQDLVNVVKAPAQSLLGPLTSGRGIGGALTSPVSSTITASPQQFPLTGPLKLFTNTATNLEAWMAARAGNPLPVPTQLLNNQIAHLQTLGTAFQAIGQNFATFGKGLPGVFQTTRNFLEQGDVFDAITYFATQVVVNPLIADLGLPLIGAVVPILQDSINHTAAIINDPLVVLFSALAPLYGPNAAIGALAGVSQDIVNAFSTGNFLTGFEDIALAPTTILDGLLNGYPVSAPNLFIDPSGGLFTGNPGSSQPGFGTVGILRTVNLEIAKDLGADAG